MHIRPHRYAVQNLRVYFGNNRKRTLDLIGVHYILHVQLSRSYRCYLHLPDVLWQALQVYLGIKSFKYTSVDFTGCIPTYRQSSDDRSPGGGNLPDPGWCRPTAHHTHTHTRLSSSVTNCSRQLYRQTNALTYMYNTRTKTLLRMCTVRPQTNHWGKQ